MDIIEDTVSMRDIDRLEAIANVTGGKVRGPIGALSYGLIEDIGRAENRVNARENDEDYND